MRVLHLSATGVDGGGAAIATYRLHQGLRDAGTGSRVLVGNDTTSDPTVDGTSGRLGRWSQLIRKGLDLLPVYYYRDRDSGPFSPAWLPERRRKQIEPGTLDIVHLHWVAGGFLNPKTIADLNVPVVWTMHDMWPFTGGCHYSKGCERYVDSCGACPHLGSERPDDLSRSVWTRKQEAYREANLTVVSPSRWLAECARNSSLFGDVRVEVIPNGIDTHVYRPRDRSMGVERLGLDPDVRYILYGADYETPRKGWDLLRDATEQLQSAEDVRLLVFGNSEVDSERVPIPVSHLGYLSENDLRIAYSTADVTVIPSRQDNLPNIGVESLASGTPVVAFEVGGLPDIVTHKQTGYLASSFDTTDLANGIEWVINDEDRITQLSEAARQSATDRFELQTVAQQYAELYEELLT